MCFFNIFFNLPYVPMCLCVWLFKKISISAADISEFIYSPCTSLLVFLFSLPPGSFLQANSQGQKSLAG